PPLAGEGGGEGTYCRRSVRGSPLPRLRRTLPRERGRGRFHMTSALLPSLQDAVAELDKPFFPVERRRSALSRFAAMGFPTTRSEAWRHTDVSGIAAKGFAPARLVPAAASAAAPYVLPATAGRLAFVNGFFAPSLSDTARLPSGVEAGPLAVRP